MIVKIGWFPLNRNLSTMPEIRATMTANERQIETSSSSIILPNKCPVKQVSATSAPESETQKYTLCDSTINSTETSTLTMTTTSDTNPPSLNSNTGTALFVLDAIVQHEDLQKARERIKKEQEDDFWGVVTDFIGSF